MEPAVRYTENVTHDQMIRCIAGALSVQRISTHRTMWLQFSKFNWAQSRLIWILYFELDQKIELFACFSPTKRWMNDENLRIISLATFDYMMDKSNQYLFPPRIESTLNNELLP